MSYRVDIPTLSANEVYTLTFEYEGTETIQLIVGDLTLETTDRRVVFTTTSPVNYIESNVNLTNLNMYEGYYESDDFGGEYTQESYIEGMSLINLINVTDSDFPKQTSFYDFTINKNISDDKYYTLIVDVSDTSGGFDYGVINNQGTSFTYLSDTITTDGKYIVYRTFNGASQIIRFRGKTSGSPITINSLMLLEGDYSDGNVGHFTGIGCVKSPTIKSLSPENLYVSPLKYREPLRGYEYYHNDGAVEIYPNGSGAYSTIDLYTGEDVGMTYLGNHKDWYVKNGIKLGLGAGTYYFCCEIELVANKQITDFSDRPQVDVIFDDGDYFSVNGSFTETYDGEKYYYKGIFGASNKTVTDDIRGVYVGIWSYGNSAVEKYIIRNITLTKEASLKDICAISKSSMITTPNDLELYCNYHYDRTTKTSSPCYQDTLDLTTGTVTRKNIKVRLNDYIAIHGSVSGELVAVNGGDMVRVHYNHNNSSTFIFPVQIDGEVTGLSATGIVFSASQGGYDGHWYPTGDIEHAYANTNSVYMFFNPSRFEGIDYTDSTTIKNWLIEQDFTLIMKIHNSSAYTEQLSLNPLKSYQNGSIQTSSQQLAPTLTTTLPISNKFTTTNLTSGSTYNVYFDGTATKLDAGGTIITNPISPCEVECGGTTLTIEGTDIQNVRVIETTVKNEVGSVNGTTDVELKKMKTCKYENILDDINYNTTVWNGAVININYDDFCIEFMGNHGWAAEFADTGLKYPTGCSLVHVEFDIDMDNPNLRMAINFNEGIYNSYPQHRHVTLNNDTATIAQGNYENVYTSIITKGHFSRLMYANGDRPIIINLYTGSYITNILATGNSAEGSIDGYETIGSNYARITNLRMRIIENFSSNYTTVTSVLRDSSYNIIWQDMDMTMPVTTSNLEQPIKLRSLGTTYDSYNPVTGELIKRIGVSETDGSYSVLSSPIVSKVKTTLGILTNIRGERITLSPEQRKHDYLLNNCKPNTDYFIVANVMATESTRQINIGFIVDDTTWSGSPVTLSYGEMRIKLKINSGSTPNYLRIYANSCENLMIIEHQDSIENKDIPYFEGTQDVVIDVAFETPQLYTNGQVKVYSDSEVYPTTILNGQSTNNYEINELNTSNNYTIRYEGECESINLAKKSNTQGTNRIVKAGATSGNLTFVNDNGDIDNVLLVQNDVREQEINHFTGLETVEVSRMLIETSRNMWWNDWIEPSQHDADWLVDSADYIQVNGGETIYIVAIDNTYYSIVEFDENYTRINFSNTLIGNRQQQTVVKDGYYKNFLKLRDNTKYIKFVAPKGSAQNQTSNPTFTFSRVELNEPTLSANIPYQLVIIDLPQPVQLNGLPDGTCDTYNPITGEYVQNVGYTDSTDYDTYYQLVNPIITQLTPINIPTFEGGILQLITTDGKVFPMIEYSMPTNNRYDTSSWEAGKVYTQRNMTEAYFNESTTPMIPTETMTLTTDHISSGSIILNDNGNGLIVLKGNYTGRDIPYFTGMRSVEAIEVETTPSPDQPLFGKGGRK